MAGSNFHWANPTEPFLVRPGQEQPYARPPLTSLPAPPPSYLAATTGTAGSIATGAPPTIGTPIPVPAPNGVLSMAFDEMDKDGFGLLGLENAGNSCYINAALQLLFYMKNLCVDLAAARDYGLARWVGNIGIQHWSGIPLHLKKTDIIGQINRYMSEEYKYKGVQEDSHEFFKKVLERLGLDQIVKAHLGGRQLFLTTCLVCGTRSPRYEDFDQFQINAGVCLKTFFAELFQPEVMINDNRYECAHCNQIYNPSMTVPNAVWRTKSNGDKTIYSDARREYFVSQWPRLLVFQIARFSNEPPLFAKLTHAFDFPLKFKKDMDKDAVKKDIAAENDDRPGAPPYFRLCFLVVHEGKRSTGHYYAYGRHPNGTFVKYNDDTVTTQISPEELTKIRIRKNVYILVYEPVIPPPAVATTVV